MLAPPLGCRLRRSFAARGLRLGLTFRRRRTRYRYRCCHREAERLCRFHEVGFRSFFDLDAIEIAGSLELGDEIRHRVDGPCLALDFQGVTLAVKIR